MRLNLFIWQQPDEAAILNNIMRGLNFWMTIIADQLIAKQYTILIELKKMSQIFISKILFQMIVLPD